MKVVILSFTQAGTRLGERIGSQFRNEGITCQNYAPAGYAFADILPFPDNPKELIREGWGETSFLFIGAVGIAVRYIAPYVKDKFTDSAVVVMDEKAGYVSHCCQDISGVRWNFPISLQYGPAQFRYRQQRQMFRENLQ